MYFFCQTMNKEQIITHECVYMDMYTCVFV